MRASESSLRARFEDADFPWVPRHEQSRARAALLGRVLPSERRALAMVDLGCGAGENTTLLAAALGIAGPVGLDWARRPLVAARGAGVAAVQGVLDGADLPFADASVDVVVMSEVIEHLVATDHAAREAWRVLRPGGALLVTTPNLAAWFNRVLIMVGIQPVYSEVSAERVLGRPGHQVVGHLRLFTLRALVGFLRHVGFVGVQVSGVPFHGVPGPLRPLDRLLARRANLAAGVMAVGLRPAAPS